MQEIAHCSILYGGVVGVACLEGFAGVGGSGEHGTDVKIGDEDGEESYRCEN